MSRESLEKEGPPEEAHTEKQSAAASDTVAHQPGRPSKGRVTYMAAGEAMRQTFAKAAKEDLSPGEYRVLAAVVCLTASYSKLKDRVYRAEVAKLAHYSEKRTGLALGKLDKLGIIIWKPSGKRGKPSLLALRNPNLGERHLHSYEDIWGYEDGAFRGTARGTTVVPVPSSSTKKLPSSSNDDEPKVDDLGAGGGKGSTNGSPTDERLAALLDGLGPDPLNRRQREEALKAATEDPAGVEALVAASEGSAATFLAGVTDPERRDGALVRRFVNEHGWPTGARWVLGTHAGTHIFDPLGTDHPPDDFPHPRPSKAQVIAALRKAAA